VANQGSNSVALYSINPATGLLTQLSQTIVLSAPVCVLPFFTQPPQPVLGVSPASNGSLQVGVGNGCGVLGYQLFQASALTSSPSWNMLAAGATGQTNFCLTNFVLTNTRPQAFFRVSVTNY